MDKEEMDLIKDLAILNYVEIQHLKKLLCDHFKIEERVGLYTENLEKYLDEREQRGGILAEEIKDRRRS